MLLGEQPLARNYRLEGSPRRNNLTKDRTHPVPQRSWSRAREGCGIRKQCRRVQLRNASEGMLQTLHCVRSTNGKDFQYCNCNENSAVPQDDQPLHAVAFASRHLRISLRHVGTEPFEGAVIFRHIGSKLVQISSESVQGALLYFNCCIVFPSPTFERARWERKQLTRLSRAGISYHAAHPFSPSPPRIFGQAIGGILLLLVMRLRRE